MIWDKKEVPPELVKSLGKTYAKGDLLIAAILARRGITEGKDILYFLEDDLRYQHSPFLFPEMEDAVDRILQAKEEGEKVLVFGDRDVDGVTATALLVSALRRMGADVSWQVPLGDEPYGLTVEAVEKFAADYGTLIITVDCGISNHTEIARAAELGVDVLVIDHHNPPENLPEPCVIVNPKTDDSYPCKDISACAVAWKVVSALAFAASEFYKQEICLLNVVPLTEAWSIECVKVVNCVKKAALTEAVAPGAVSFSQTRLEGFLRGQQIFVWDAALQTKQLRKVFGDGVEFNLWDLRDEIASAVPSVAGLSLLRVREASKIARYGDAPVSEIDCFFNLFVTYTQKKLQELFPRAAEQEAKDLQLVALAALADIMPMRDENRLFVSRGLKSLGPATAAPGLLELLAAQNLLNRRVSSKDLAWSVCPGINAAGRMGNAALGVELFLNDDPARRTALAKEIVGLNEERKALVEETLGNIKDEAFRSLEEYGGKLCVVLSGDIPRGISGLAAVRLLQMCKVTSIAGAIMEDGTVSGSIRTAPGVNAPGFLGNFADLFVNYGGHPGAGGFSLEGDKTGEFLERLKALAPSLEKSEQEEETVTIDAEIPHAYMKPDKLLFYVDAFEPFGAENPELRFLVRNAKVMGAEIIGKTEKKHLRLDLKAGEFTWPARFWNAADRYGADFAKGDRVDAVFAIERNFYGGEEKAQMIIIDIKRSEGSAG